MKKYLSLLLLGCIVQFAAADAGCCQKGCKKEKVAKSAHGCKKDKAKKADKKARKNRDKSKSSDSSASA